MKQIRQLLIFFIIMMTIGLLVFINLGKKTAYGKRDILYYNDQLFAVEDELKQGVPEEEIEDRYGCEIIMGKQINDPELAVMYSEGALVLDLMIDDEYVGKVAWNDLKDNYDDSSEEFLRAALILWGAVFISGILLLLYMYFSFVRPVGVLKEFTEDIAKGDLDKSLPMPRNPLFADLSEGFDLMREELKSSIDRERQAEIARKEQIQSLSHDIKTPIAVIGAACEVLTTKYTRKLEGLDKFAGMTDGTDSKWATTLKDEYGDMLDKVGSISGKAESISSIMSDVMHVSLEDMEKVEVNPVEERSDLIEEFIGRMRSYGRINIHNHIYPCLVYMDRQRMEQVIDNIIGNSCKYAGTDIDVYFSESDDILMSDGKKGRFLKVTIKDHGQGVDPEDLPLIAQKYYRGHNSTSQTGYGLGLYLAKTYMDKQGGGLEFYNDNGFVVELLLKKV
ncbi:MAG: HAMP domain-containing histidine kinase [Lachnospiraceae bacterium]|nr:HAMP domain-containing histidine kinase [Lachnospiraceae bacterium]